MDIQNKKAYYDYFIEKQVECGIALKGNEVKSIREGACNLKGAWCQVQGGNLVLRGMHISPWKTANSFDIDEDRERQLLAHKREIAMLGNCVLQNGITLIPLKLYFNHGKCKVLVGVCKGKHNYDKREVLKTAQAKREINRELKEANR